MKTQNYLKGALFAAAVATSVIGTIAADKTEVDTQNISAQVEHGLTPLMQAAGYFGYTEQPAEVSVKALLENKADVTRRDDKGFTALRWSVQAYPTERRDVAKMLIEYGSDVNSQADDGTTSLMRVAELGNLEITKMLICNGADVNIKDNKGKTAMDRVKEIMDDLKKTKEQEPAGSFISAFREEENKTFDKIEKILTHAMKQDEQLKIECEGEQVTKVVPSTSAPKVLDDSGN